MDKPGVEQTASVIDIEGGKSGFLALVYSRQKGSPFYFDTQDHQKGDEPKYRLKPDEEYKGTILIEDRKRRQKEWPIRVHSNVDELGIYDENEER